MKDVENYELSNGILCIEIRCVVLSVASHEAVSSKFSLIHELWWNYDFYQKIEWSEEILPDYELSDEIIAIEIGGLVQAVAWSKIWLFKNH